MKPISAEKVRVSDTFWTPYMELVRKVIVPYQWEVMNDRVEGVAKSHAVANVRIAAGLEEGEFYGFRFQDSDLAKWLEAAAWCLATERDPGLESLADGLIEDLGRAQWPDGYLNTYFTLKEKGKRWTCERDSHELYVAGHLIEAAVAYHRATGKTRFLDIMRVNADHIDSIFGPQEGKLHGYPGHQVTEMALVGLYGETGEKRYLDLARYFIDERGRKPAFFELEAAARGQPDDKGYFGERMAEYNQTHLPVREQKKATGHAVRAVYMYSAMADLAAIDGDAKLAEACRELWKDVTRRQMFVTGGIGQDESWEGFSEDYDLPNASTYNETCASIGLVFWAARMARLERKGDYFDVAERALHNGVLSGISLDGRKYFYVNLLESLPSVVARTRDMSYASTTRKGWFPCACCPPNLARLIASIGGYIYSSSPGGRGSPPDVSVQLYIASEASLDIAGAALRIALQGDYPRSGRVGISVSPDRPAYFSLRLRIPGWCTGFRLSLNGGDLNLAPVEGYVSILREWASGDSVDLELPMPVRRVAANPAVTADAGKVAIARGPVIYCLEEVDNGPNLADIVLAAEPRFSERFEEGLLGGVVAVYADAFRRGNGGEGPREAGEGGIQDRASELAAWGDDLYRDYEPFNTPLRIKAVPYYAWDNRGESEMLVWIRQS